MPLLRIDRLCDGTRIGIWRMDEALQDLPRPAHLAIGGMRSIKRQKEQLTTYCLLEAMTGRRDLVIGHAESGKPIVDAMEISLSHTKGWAAMIVSEDKAVGVDIEYRSNRVDRIASRFIRPDEQSATLAQRLINWSAKETVYKLLSDENLTYHDMRLHAIAEESRGEVLVDDLKCGGHVVVSYIFNQDYVLTWAFRDRQKATWL